MSEAETKDNVQDDEAQMTVGGCRMYEKEYPDADEVVLVQVKQVAEMGAYVTLLEYNNINGMILASELSRRRIRSMNKVIRVGKTEVVVVLRVDKDKGYIDLSKRRVIEEDIIACENRYAMSKQVHSLLSRVAQQSGTELIDLYKLFGWPLYRKYGHAYEAFKIIVNGNESILDEFNLPEAVRSSLVMNIKRRLTPQPNTIRATVEVTCFGYEGIDAIKEALSEGLKVGDVSIRLLAPPQYLITTVNVNAEAGIQLVESAIAKITETLKAKEGHISVKEAARVINESDEKKMKEDMINMGKENAQVAADDPTDD